MHSNETLPDGSTVNMITYDMDKSLKSCVELYASLAPPQSRIKHALIPSGHEFLRPIRQPVLHGGAVIH